MSQKTYKKVATTGYVRVEGYYDEAETVAVFPSFEDMQINKANLYLEAIETIKNIKRELLPLIKDLEKRGIVTGDSPEAKRNQKQIQHYQKMIKSYDELLEVDNETLSAWIENVQQIHYETVEIISYQEIKETNTEDKE